MRAGVPDSLEVQIRDLAPTCSRGERQYGRRGVRDFYLTADTDKVGRVLGHGQGGGQSPTSGRVLLADHHVVVCEVATRGQCRLDGVEQPALGHQF